METYICPMHPEIKQHKPGNCPKCGMKLVLDDGTVATKAHGTSEDSYFPLFLIIGLISFVTIILGVQAYLTQTFSLQVFLMNFMAGFFLTFSAFKLLDIRGFAEGYSTYDLLAQRVNGYGYVYPFIEFVLGILFLLHVSNPVLSLFTFILMTFSGIGVANKIIKKEQFQCACLGTFLKVPLTKVTLVEDFGMAGMAVLMYFLGQ